MMKFRQLAGHEPMRWLRCQVYLYSTMIHVNTYNHHMYRVPLL